jgi:hypothetical protein
MLTIRHAGGLFTASEWMQRVLIADGKRLHARVLRKIVKNYARANEKFFLKVYCSLEVIFIILAEFSYFGTNL